MSLNASISAPGNPREMISVLEKQSGEVLSETSFWERGSGKNRSEQLRQISQITSTVVGSASLPTQARDLAEKVRAVFAVDACVIRLIEDESLTLLASAGIPKEKLAPKVPLNLGISKEIILKRSPILIKKASEHPVTVPCLDYSSSSYQFTSYVGAPLISENRIVGVLGLYTEAEIEGFSVVDLEYLQIVANHVCVSIVNDQLYKEIHAQKDSLEKHVAERRRAEIRSAAFSRLGQQLCSATNPENAARIVVAVADELLGWDSCYLNLYDLKHDVICSLLAIDLVNGQRTNTALQPKGAPSKITRKVITEGGQLILRKEPVTSSDFAAFGNNQPSASLLIVPIRSQDNVVGLLSIQSYTKNAYDLDGLETLQALADHCGGALERLTSDAERKAAEERHSIFSRLGNKLSAATTQVEAAQMIVDVSNQLFAFDSCTVDLYLEGKNAIQSLIIVDTVDGKRMIFPSTNDGRAPSPLAQRVMKQGGEIILRREAIPAPDTFAFGSNRPSLSLIYVPIRNAEKVIGFLSVQSYTADAYQPDDLLTLQSLADYCGGAFERICNRDDLALSERRFRTLSESTPIGIFETDAEGAHTFANPRWHAIYGLTPSEGLDHGWVKATHPEDREVLFEKWRDTVRDGREWISEHRLLVNSLVRWVREVSTPVFSKEGKKISYVGTVEDITSRKRAEQNSAALSKLGQNLSAATSPKQAARLIGEIAYDLFKWDACTLDLHIDDTVIPLLTMDTVNGERVDVVPTYCQQKTSARSCRIMTSGAELNLKEEAVFFAERIPFGSCRPSLSAMYVPIRNSTRAIGIISVQSYAYRAYDQQDLATLQTLADHCGGALERIRIEEALKSSEVRFHSIWENSVDGMRLTDENGIILAVNNAFCKLVEMPREELEGKPFTVSYAVAESHDQLLQKYKNRFQTRVIQKVNKRTMTFSSGKTVELEDTNSFIELADGKPMLLGLFRDITAEKRLEEELRHSQKMDSIGQLAGGVAHDFNNILTVIHGHASLLLMTNQLPKTAADSIQQISTAAERAASLTRQLLAFSRKQVMQTKALDLNEAVSNMTKMLQRVLGEDISLQVHFSSNLPLVQADPGMMEQILLNLGVNSRDAMPSGGQLLIHTTAVLIDETNAKRSSKRRPGPFVCLEVRDSGCGMSPEIMARIFEPFFTTKDVGKGTGLGLATVYGIVKQHEGWVEVNSEIGRGTTFKIFLPSHNGVLAPEVKLTPAKMRGGSETILLVEDEPEVRNLSKTILRRLGYKILEASSGVEALEIWRDRHSEVDLLLTDMVMPGGVTGRDLAQKLSSEKPALKVIYTSGYSKDFVGKNFVLQEGVNFLQKPYLPPKLAKTVRDSLDNLRVQP